MNETMPMHPLIALIFATIAGVVMGNVAAASGLYNNSSAGIAVGLLFGFLVLCHTIKACKDRDITTESASQFNSSSKGLGVRVVGRSPD
jgi:hypothetical protein